MSTSAISGTTNTSSVTTNTEVRMPGGELGINEFLELLAAQLANQDPLEPMDDTDFIAQLAQFSSLEAMSTMSASFLKTQAYSLVGKNVFAVMDVDGVGTQVEGYVSGVVTSEGKDYLQVGDYLVPQEAVQAVYDTSALEGAILQGAALVGKDVTAVVPTPTESDPAAYTTVSGTVDTVLASGGQLYERIGDTDVPLTYIMEIG